MAEKNRVCPECRKSGHDSDGNHLFMMADGLTWYCHHNDYHEDGKPYREVGGRKINVDQDGEVVSLESLIESTREPEVAPDEPIVQKPTTSTLSFGTPQKMQPQESSKTSTASVSGSIKQTYRGVLPETFKKYGTTGSYSGNTLTQLAHWIHDIKGNPLVEKYREIVAKDFVLSGKTKGRTIQMFGQKQFPSAKRLLIVEGELDAMSAYQMLKKYKVIVWSVPLGANKKTIIDNMNEIQKFLKGNKELYFCFDNDKVGQELHAEVAAIFPKSKHLALTDLKDANDYLVAGRSSDFIGFFWDAEIYRPPSIVSISSIMGDILKEPEIGTPWPWPTLTSHTYGRRGGEGMFVGAGVKCGKSEFINEVIAFDCANSHKIGVIKFEEPPPMTAKRVAGKLDGIFYHKPGTKYNIKDLERTAGGLDGNLILHRAFGTADWDSIKPFIHYCLAMGCRTIIIDPITKITNGKSASDTETELRRFSDELACMAQDLGFFYIVTCHLKAPERGLSHERGGKVETYQFRGSRSMAENCYYFLGIQRNKDPELSEDERNTSTFVLLEDRAFGNVCSFPVFYNKTTQSYLEQTFSSIL